jgi:hypothetical protein
MHFRVPIDDEHTRIIWIGLFVGIPGGEITADDAVPYTYEFDQPGLTLETVDITTFYGQDRVVWETQGAVTDRSIETLGATDRGIVLFRRMLAEQIDRVENGEEPNVAFVTDPEKNDAAVVRVEQRELTRSGEAFVHEHQQRHEPLAIGRREQLEAFLERRMMARCRGFDRAHALGRERDHHAAAVVGIAHAAHETVAF